MGVFTSLALDGQGNPRISYYDITNIGGPLSHCMHPQSRRTGCSGRARLADASCTWNVNAFVLWDRERWNVPRLGLNLSSPADVGREQTLDLIRNKFVPGLLAEVGDIYAGLRAMWWMLR